MKNKAKDEIVSPVTNKPFEETWCIKEKELERIINESIDAVKGSTTSPEVMRGQIWEGLASYYSEDGCIGCSPTLTMANGIRLDDTKPTVAFNRLPLGSIVRVLNKANMMFTDVEVTDTGGFERHGRIIDLNLATKQKIGCSDLCMVRITEI